MKKQWLKIFNVLSICFFVVCTAAFVYSQTNHFLANWRIDPFYGFLVKISLLALGSLFFSGLLTISCYFDDIEQKKKWHTSKLVFRFLLIVIAIILVVFYCFSIGIWASVSN